MKKINIYIETIYINQTIIIKIIYNYRLSISISSDDL